MVERVPSLDHFWFKVLLFAPLAFFTLWFQIGLEEIQEVVLKKRIGDVRLTRYVGKDVVKRKVSLPQKRKRKKLPKFAGIKSEVKTSAELWKKHWLNLMDEHPQRGLNILNKILSENWARLPFVPVHDGETARSTLLLTLNWISPVADRGWRDLHHTR